MFETQRPKDIFLNQGVASELGELTYHEFKDPTLNSFSDEVYERNKNTFLNKQTVPVKPLSSILDEHLPTGKQIDLMNIDVEGLDFEVLQSNDWEKYSPRVLVIEDHEFDPENPLESKILKFLKSKGYVLKANCLISLVLLKE